MKIAFPTSSNSLDGSLETRFGRSPAFLIYDSESQQIEILSNSNAEHAGLGAAQLIARAGVHALICSHCGPKAFQVLKKAEIPVYLTTAQTARTALEQFDKKQLQTMTEANVGGHW